MGGLGTTVRCKLERVEQNWAGGGASKTLDSKELVFSSSSLLQIKSVMTFDALLHVIMFSVSALKVLSDGDGKIPTKKVKVRVKTSIFLCDIP